MEDHATRLRKLARSRSSDEMYQYRRTIYPDRDSETAALDRIDQAYDEAEKLIDECAIPSGVPAATLPGWEARRKAMLAAVEHNLNAPVAPHIRAARLQGLRDSNAARAADLRDAETLPAVEIANLVHDMLGKAEKAVAFLAKLARDPVKFYNAASKFINNDILRALEANGLKISSKLRWSTTNQFIDTLKANKLTKEVFDIAGDIFEAAAKVYGILQVGLEIVTAVFKTAADTGHWGTIVSKEAVAIGTGVALGMAAASAAAEEAVGSVLGTIAAAVSATAEVPPVFIALVAAGVVAAATWAVTELFSAVIDWLFGDTDIPAILRTETATCTIGETSTATYRPVLTKIA